MWEQVVAIYNERGDRWPPVEAAGITEVDEPEETMPEARQQHPAPNSDPEHFPDNRPERVQNFSFASSYPYAPGRASNTNSNSNYNSNYNSSSFNVQRYQSPYNFQHVVTNAFSVLRHQPSEDQEHLDSFPARPQQAIVRPTIRREEAATTEPRDHEHVEAVNPPARSFFSRSNQEVRSFADELSHKLRFLAPEENYGGSHSAGSGAWLDTAMAQRPRFETTVPQGIFLPPPHEVQMIPATMLRRHVYAYSSYPMILQSYYSKEPSPRVSESKEQKVTATRLNGVRATAALAAATAAAATTAAAASKSNNDPSQSLAGGLHITKAQFQQQLQQRRANHSDKR